MEDDLKISNLDYLSNHWSDLPQMLYLSLWDQTKIEDCLKWRRLPMEDNHKISNIKISNPNWKFLEVKMTFYWRQPQNIKSGISQQPLIWTSSNFKLNQIKIKYCLNWRWLPKASNTSDTSTHTPDTICAYLLASNRIRFGPQLTLQEGSYHHSLMEEQHRPECHLSRY